MGASNVKPHTAHISNPYPRPVAVEVTPNVITRLESVRNAQLEQEREREELIAKQAQAYPVKHLRDEDNCNSKSNNDKDSSSSTDTDNNSKNTPPSKAHELEQTSFVQTMQQLENSWGRPINWTQDMGTEKDLSNLRTQLIQCYRDHPKKTLECAKIATDFQNIAFDGQFKTILKHKDIPIQIKPLRTKQMNE